MRFFPLAYMSVGQITPLELPGYLPPGKQGGPPYLYGPYPQSAARFPYPHNYQNMGEQPNAVQVPHILWLLDPNGKLVAGGDVYNKETAEYVYNVWGTQFMNMPDGTERMLWRYSGTYDNAHLPRYLLRRTQLLTSGTTRYWHSLPPQFCSKSYCPSY